MCGNGRPRISDPTLDSRASLIPNTPRPSSAASTRFSGAAPGLLGRAPFGTAFGIGTTLSAARFSAAFGVPRMPDSTMKQWSSGGAALRHPNPRMVADVAAGLAAPQKELPPKYFYDHRGSELFEEITRLPEYYPTRTERRLLEDWIPKLITELGTQTLVELGAGSAEKSRIILSAIRACGSAGLYVPIDVSASFLEQTAGRLRREYPGLRVEPA